MLSEDLFDLIERAACWRRLIEQVRDKRALEALRAMLAVIEKKIACIQTKIFDA